MRHCRGRRGAMPPLYVTVRVVLSCVATHTAMRDQGVLSRRCGVTKDRDCRHFFSMMHAVRLSPSSHGSRKNHAHPAAGPSYTTLCSPLCAPVWMILSYPCKHTSW